MTNRKIKAPHKPPDSFTIEQVEAAALKAVGDEAASFVIAALTKSKWDGQKGEVYAWTNSPHTEYKYAKSEGGYINPETITIRRPLTPDEVPAWKRDQAALKVAIDYIQAGHSSVKGTYETLAKIKELING